MLPRITFVERPVYFQRYRLFSSRPLDCMDISIKWEHCINYQNFTTAYKLFFIKFCLLGNRCCLFWKRFFIG